MPLLGICLGHQVIAAEAGGDIGRAPEPVHGKAGRMEHDGSGVFAGLPSPMMVGRYHSLAATRLPPRLRVTASCGSVVMAVEDPIVRQIGLQFHPESILTPLGDRILANVLTMAAWEGQVSGPSSTPSKSSADPLPRPTWCRC